MSRSGRYGMGTIGWMMTGLTTLMLAPTGGCDVLTALLGNVRPTTRVELINDGNFDVDVVMYIYDIQEAPREVITELGERVALTVPPGQTRSIQRDCDDLQAVVIDDADLKVIGQIGPEANSEVLRDGTDFDCGDAIEFVFDHGDLFIDFDVTANVRRQ